jgi:hypothetical protein
MRFFLVSLSNIAIFNAINGSQKKTSKEQMTEDKAAVEVDAKALKASFKNSYKVILLTVSTMLDENGER